MSTRQELRFDQTRAATELLSRELTQRSLARAGQHAAGAEIAYRQCVDRLRSCERQVQAAAAESAAAAQALGALRCETEASRAQLTAAASELRAELDRAARLDAAIAAEEQRMSRTIGEAQRSLEHVARVAEQGTATIGELAPAERERLAARQGEIERNLHQIDLEVRFLGHDAALAPAAVATLMAMEANGYQLRDTASEGDLVSYFAREGAAHQIAVRMAPVERRGEDVAAWELVAETFGMAGEDCLYEIEDFETAFEQLDLGRLTPGRRVYPKDDRGARVIPAPRAKTHHKVAG